MKHSTDTPIHASDLQRLLEATPMPDDHLSASEAVYAFAAWITTRDETITASAAHDSAPWAQLVAQFCERQRLAEPRAHYADRIVPTASKDHDEDRIEKGYDYSIALQRLIEAYCRGDSLDDVAEAGLYHAGLLRERADKTASQAKHDFAQKHMDDLAYLRGVIRLRGGKL